MCKIKVKTSETNLLVTAGAFLGIKMTIYKLGEVKQPKRSSYRIFRHPAQQRVYLVYNNLSPLNAEVKFLTGVSPSLLTSPTLRKVFFSSFGKINILSTSVAFFSSCESGRYTLHACVHCIRVLATLSSYKTFLIFIKNFWIDFSAIWTCLEKRESEREGGRRLKDS